MDIRDVTHEETFHRMLVQALANLEIAKKRKGEIPHDHPPPYVLLGQFSATLKQTSYVRAEKNTNLITTSQMPPSYLPCDRSIDNLEPMMIKGMMLETHHRGKKVFLRVLTLPNWMNAVMVAEDMAGTAILVALYHQLEDQYLNREDILKPGNICVIKEPFFKAATHDGAYNIRVDHLSDIIWLHGTDERIPFKWRRSNQPMADKSETFRKQGNVAVGKGDWSVAERLYSSAIIAADNLNQKQLAYLNRSLANLKLGRQEKALVDATDSQGDAGTPGKSMFREARALYELGRFEMSLEKLQTLERLHPEIADAKPEITRTKSRIKEQTTGEYDWSSMYKQARATSPNVDCATYFAPVAIQLSPGCGRGLFTTRPVVAGELLLCEKAFAYNYVEVGNSGRNQAKVLLSMSSRWAQMGGQVDMLSRLVQKLYHNPAGSRPFLDLHRGAYESVSVSEADGNPVVDSFLVEQILTLNVFGAPRSSLESLTNTDHDEESKYSTCGIWPIASHINHSCLRNCIRAFIGDVMVVRACSDLEAGTELRFCYKSALKVQTYDEVQKGLEGWGFVCSCALCLERKATPRRTKQTRERLFADLKRAMNAQSGIQPSRFERILEQLEKTYSLLDGENLSRLELGDPYCSLGLWYLTQSWPAEAVDWIIKGLEALGYSIAAVPRGTNPGKKARFEVVKWGIMCEIVLIAFQHLFRTYKLLAPKLCPVVRQYFATVYLMQMGENTTMLTTFPELRD